MVSVLKKINNNTYMVDLLDDLKVSKIFNIIDLHDYSLDKNLLYPNINSREFSLKWRRLMHSKRKKRKLFS